MSPVSKREGGVSARVRRRLVIGGLIALAIVVPAALLLFGGGGGGGGDSDDPSGGGAAADDGGGVGRVVPGALPEGFRVLEFRDLSDPSPFPQPEVRLRVYGRADGDDPFGGGDVGVLAIASAGSQGARAFAFEPEEVEIGGMTAYRSDFPFGEEPLRVIAWDVPSSGDPDREPESDPGGAQDAAAQAEGVVAFVASRSLDDALLETLVEAVTLDDEAPLVPDDALPDGFREVTAGNASFLITGSPPAGSPGYEIQYLDDTNPSNRIALSRWRADLDWQPMVRWWLGSPGRRIRLDGRSASVAAVRGADDGAPPTFLVSWSEGAVATILTATGLTEDQVADVVRSLREAGDDEWAEITDADGSVPAPPAP